ncbi:hypothetical protein BHE74_00040544 [Ensete ventricosum]|nr:hypothetical protein BHE74_00040544 [Ensete ventricosum]
MGKAPAQGGASQERRQSHYWAWQRRTNDHLDVSQHHTSSCLWATYAKVAPTAKAIAANKRRWSFTSDGGRKKLLLSERELGLFR